MGPGLRIKTAVSWLLLEGAAAVLGDGGRAVGEFGWAEGA